MRRGGGGGEGDRGGEEKMKKRVKEGGGGGRVNKGNRGEGEKERRVSSVPDSKPINQK